MKTLKWKSAGMVIALATLTGTLLAGGPGNGNGPGDYPGSNGVPFQAVQDQIDDLQEQIDVLRNDLETAVLEIELELADLRTDVDANAAAIADLEADLAILQQDLADLEAEVDGKQDRVEGSCPAGWSIRQINEDGSVICEKDTIATERIYQRVVSRTIGRYSTLSLVAPCPTGFRLMGGGIQLNSSTTALNIVGSAPYANGWRGIVRNSSRYSGYRLTVTAICTQERAY